MDDRPMDDRQIPLDPNDPDQRRWGPITPIGAVKQPPVLYPVTQLPPRMHGAINAIITIADCHPNTAAWAVMGSASAAAQCVATVETLAGKGREVPASLFTHLIAPSGSRKSTAFSAAWSGLLKADDRLQKSHLERRARAADSKAKPGDSNYIAHRASGTIRQIVSEPTMEAMVRDTDLGHPYPVLASAEGASFYYGYSSGSGNSGRATQTASILAGAYSGEAININRIGSDGRAPNRSVGAGAYAIGLHYAVQDAAMGHDMLFGPDSEYGMGARVLAYVTPPRETIIPHRYDEEDIEIANHVLHAWSTHLQSIRTYADQPILLSDHGGTPRCRMTLPTSGKDIVHGLLAELAPMADTPEDKAIYDRIAEQVIRIAATIQIAEQGIPGVDATMPVHDAYLHNAGRIATYHWDTRQNIAGASLATHVDETCASIIANAMRWRTDGAGSKGKRGYDPSNGTWGWAALLGVSKHTGPRGKYARDSDFKLRCRTRLMTCNLMDDEGQRVVFNPKSEAEGIVK